MTKKSLQSWYNSDDITYSQKEVIKKFGVGDYYPECERRDFKKIWYLNEIFERRKPSIYGRIQKMIFFSAWWNNNLIIAINGEGSYGVHLIIYEMPWKNMSEVLETRLIDSGYSYLSSAIDKAHDVEGKLKGSNPIFYKYPSLELKYNDNYYQFKDVKTTDLYLPSSNVENHPDEYLKPLDIVKVHSSSGWFHSAIYLGNGKVCHARPGKDDTSSYGGYSSSYGGYSYGSSSYSYYDYDVSRGDSWGWIEVTSWKNFLKFLGSPNKVVRLHPLVPYKSKDKVTNDLAEAIEGAVKYYEKRGRFRTRVDDNGKSNNCEHFVNLITHGIDISEFTEKKKVEKGHEYAERYKYYNLESKMSENSSFFSSLTSSHQGSRISQVKNYTNSGTVGEGIMYEGINMDARIEVEPKSWYRMN